MLLKILLPYRVFVSQKGVQRVVLETRDGSYGVLPHRLDFAAMLVPGILVYENAQGQERYVATDKGIAVKKGSELVVSVRNAVGDTDLGKLQHAIESEFATISEDETGARTTAAKLESSLLRRFMDIKHD